MTPTQLSAAYAVDLLLGDPEWFPHPVKLFGAVIKAADSPANSPKRDLLAGAALTASVLYVGWALARPKHPAWQTLLAWTALAIRSLLQEAQSVIDALAAGNLVQARQRLSRIVGRDTGNLDEAEICRALIETLAESACDGIVAPLFWLAALGASGGMSYKAINTLDSMIGHPEPPYRYFGRVAARLDDAANWIPARLTAVLIVGASALQGLSASSAKAIWLRDGDSHASPNAGQSEAAMAGALGVRLGGANSYDGQFHESPVLHPEGRLPSISDAKSACSLVAVASALAFGVALLAVSLRRRR